MDEAIHWEVSSADALGLSENRPKQRQALIVARQFLRYLSESRTQGLACQQATIYNILLEMFVTKDQDGQIVDCHKTKEQTLPGNPTRFRRIQMLIYQQFKNSRLHMADQFRKKVADSAKLSFNSFVNNMIRKPLSE